MAVEDVKSETAFEAIVQNHPSVSFSGASDEADATPARPPLSINHLQASIFVLNQWHRCFAS
jgi:hypothetical protein